ncbi:hypothetical protein [Porphyromonas gingivalis]|uniref:hypothetical protein n=1 Tax=Porphyromonas gingivalis TaxID=837 RepID=UPI00097CDBEF|nr:hypothetical protein [Porphyromonas gingivalis]SJM18010.1 hypothetical protein PGIN_15-9_00982 [Porphyromonas gingivalis]
MDTGCIPPNCQLFSVHVNNVICAEKLPVSKGAKDWALRTERIREGLKATTDLSPSLLMIVFVRRLSIRAYVRQ